MLYITLDDYQMKLLQVKKSLLGQYETAFYQKKFQLKLLRQGRVTNLDVLASALKEAMGSMSNSASKEREIALVLPQESFLFMRIEMPVDIGPSILASYVKEKVRSQFPSDFDNCSFDFIVQENAGKKQVIVYGFDKELFENFQQPFRLLDMQVTGVIPESLAYFKLFEKTLRKDKIENIMYVSYEKDRLLGYTYDSYGLMEKDKWTQDLKKTDTVSEVLKTKVLDYEVQGKKLNRIILSGEQSDTVRQDTFTKQVGAWTNPLKRIIPNFYQEYVKMLGASPEQLLPVLEYDACIGSFILNMENKTFAILSAGGKETTTRSSSRISVPKIPVKGILMFLGSFVVAFGILFAISRINFASIKIALPSLAQATPTPTPSPTPIPPTPTPTPSVDRSKVRIKVLNGSGTKGKATEVKDLLKSKGYEDILTGNADNFDYEISEVQIKKSKRTDLEGAILSDIKDSAPSPKVTELKDTDAADIVVIFGKDFK